MVIHRSNYPFLRDFTIFSRFLLYKKWMHFDPKSVKNEENQLSHNLSIGCTPLLNSF